MQTQSAPGPRLVAVTVEQLLGRIRTLAQIRTVERQLRSTHSEWLTLRDQRAALLRRLAELGGPVRS